MIFLTTISFLIVVILFSIAVLSYCAKQKLFGLGSIFCIILIQSVIRPIFFILGIDMPHPISIFDGWQTGLLLNGIAYVMLWMICITLGYSISAKISPVVGSLFPQRPKSYNNSILLVLAILISFLGCAITCILMLGEGSIAKFLHKVKVEKAYAGFYWMRNITTHANVLLLLFICGYCSRHDESRNPKRLLLIVLFIIFVFNCSANYFWGNRYNLALILIVAGFSYHYCIDRLNIIKIFFIVLICSITLWALKIYRYELISEATSVEFTSNQSELTKLSLSFHFAQFDAFLLVLRDAGHSIDFRDGKDFGNGLISWIPRTFLPDRQSFHVGHWFRQIYEPGRVNGWPVTAAGSWYINFGLMGIVLGGILSGIIARGLDFSYKNRNFNSWDIVIGMSIAWYVFDAGLNTGTPQKYVLYVIPFFILRIFLNTFAFSTNKRCYS
tara:strand:+ start:263 stop:1588 length:1326 start_codon:yes stop_codon:yes gene_type:complete